MAFKLKGGEKVLTPSAPKKIKGVLRVRVVTFKIDEELLERLDMLAMKLGIPRSELIREAIISFINNKSSISELARGRRLRVKRIILT